MYAKVEWPVAIGGTKYHTLKAKRKREVRAAIKRYQAGWDKDFEDRTKARAELMKELSELRQVDEMAYAYNQDQEEEAWSDEEMPFCLLY